MRERFIIGLAAGVLMAAMLPGITLGATVGGPGVAGGGASAEAGASSVEPARAQEQQEAQQEAEAGGTLHVLQMWQLHKLSATRPRLGVDGHAGAHVAIGVGAPTELRP